MYSPSIERLREKRDALIEKRKDIYTVNGKGWLAIEGRRIVGAPVVTKRVPAEYLERWIKEAEIDLGLALGRASDRYEEERQS